MRAIAKQSRTICIPFFDYYWIATASPREDKLFAPCLGELSSVARLRGCRNNLVIASNSEAIQDYINPFLTSIWIATFVPLARDDKSFLTKPDCAFNRQKFLWSDHESEPLFQIPMPWWLHQAGFWDPWE